MSRNHELRPPQSNRPSISSRTALCSSSEQTLDLCTSRRESQEATARNFGQQPLEGSSSILSSPDGAVNISDGTFNAIAGDYRYLNLTINNSANKGNECRNNNPKGNTTRCSVQAKGVSKSDTSPRTAQPVKASNTSEVTELEDRPRPAETSQASYAIYYQHLASDRRGSPLWITQPNKNLPIEYQRTGIRIGDVGIITSRGYFVFLFNICYPPGHPINCNKVPSNFIPLSLDAVDDIRAHSEFGPGSYLSSASIRKSNCDMNSSGLIFESSATEGAILAMPVGSKSEDLLPVHRFQKYASLHAEEWYRYVIDVCEYPVSNGDIRLVVGHDRTSAWGMATFSGSTEHESLYLSFHPIDESSAGRTYGWEYSGMAEVRNGPDPRDVKDLRSADPSQEHVLFDNQCLFVRTINNKVPDRKWKALASELGIVDVDSDDSPGGSMDASRGHLQSYLSIKGRSSQFSQSGNNSSIYQGRRRPLSMTQDNNPMPALAEHPSDALNNMLLDLFPDAEIAVTSDYDWISVLTSGDNSLPRNEELFARISSTFNICVEDGVLFLQKDTSDAGIDIGDLHLCSDSAKSSPFSSPLLHPYDAVDVNQRMMGSTFRPYALPPLSLDSHGLYLIPNLSKSSLTNGGSDDGISSVSSSDLMDGLTFRSSYESSSTTSTVPDDLSEDLSSISKSLQLIDMPKLKDVTGEPSPLDPENIQAKLLQTISPGTSSNDLITLFSERPERSVSTTASQAAIELHRKNPARFACQFTGCNAAFTRKLGLENHHKIHLGTVDQECRFCSKRFPNSLTRHMKRCKDNPARIKTNKYLEYGSFLAHLFPRS